MSTFAGKVHECGEEEAGEARRGDDNDQRQAGGVRGAAGIL